MFYLVCGTLKCDHIKRLITLTSDCISLNLIFVTFTGEDNNEGEGGGDVVATGSKKKSEKKVFMVQEIETKLTEQQAR